MTKLSWSKNWLGSRRLTLLMAVVLLAEGWLGRRMMA